MRLIGSEFQMVGPAYENVRDPYVARLIWGSPGGSDQLSADAVGQRRHRRRVDTMTTGIHVPCCVYIRQYAGNHSFTLLPQT